MKKYFSTLALLLVLAPLASISPITVYAAGTQTPPPASVGSAQGPLNPLNPLNHNAFGGLWVLNRDKSELPGTGNLPDAAGGRRRGGGGRGGFGGRGGGGAGRGVGGGDPEQMQGMIRYMRTAMAASARLTIVVHESSVGMTDADGAILTLQTNDKKIDERAENGLVKLSRKSRWDASTLVSDIEIENGPKIERKYELSPGGTALHISTTISGGFGGRGGGGTRAILQVYERPLEQ